MNDFFRLAKEGEKPTHYIQSDSILKTEEFEKLPQDHMLGDFAGVVRLGWNPPEQKPEKDGKYLCVCRGNSIYYVNLYFEYGKWTRANKILAWSEIPPFEEEKEEWEEAFQKERLNAEPLPRELTPKYIQFKIQEFFKRGYQAGKEQR